MRAPGKHQPNKCLTGFPDLLNPILTHSPTLPASEGLPKVNKNCFERKFCLKVFSIVLETWDVKISEGREHRGCAGLASSY